MTIRKLMIATSALALLGAAPSAMAADQMSHDQMSHDQMSSDSSMPMVGGAPMSPSKTIVQNASKADNLTTLVAAVKAAGLVDTLNGDGPFTVFAPTNAAFDKLPEGTVKTLLKPENKDKLASILTYHVIPAKAMSSDAMQMIKDDGGSHKVKTVNGKELTLKMDGDQLEVVDGQGNVAHVTQADVKQSNGVVHVIDTVLMPGTSGAGMSHDKMGMSDDSMSSGKMASDDSMSSDQMSDSGMPMVGGAPMNPSNNIVQNASKADNLTTLVAAVKAAGLAGPLQGKGPFTVFAPTNAAFDKLPDGTVKTLLKPENKDKLQSILRYHLVVGDLSSKELAKRIKDGGGSYTVEAVNGDHLTLSMNGDNIVIKDGRGDTATVAQANVKQSNGMVHVIDTVLLPPKG